MTTKKGKTGGTGGDRKDIDTRTLRGRKRVSDGRKRDRKVPICEMKRDFTKLQRERVIVPCFENSGEKSLQTPLKSTKFKLYGNMHKQQHHPLRNNFRKSS